MTFNEFRAKWTPVVDDYLAAHLASEIDEVKLSKIMTYSVMAGGKRLRPLLFLATLDAINHHITAQDIQIAGGIELIHTYSLIHDDLPAMDNDDYRRGKLTSHKKWGEAEAILAGDALLPLGLQWIAEGSESADLVKIMTRAIGANGMVGGQYLDIAATNNATVATDANLINRMEWLKTGCLIVASVEMAAVAGCASAANKAKLLAFGRSFGRSYQIYDDLVDIVETSTAAGKATHKDQENGKHNTLTMLGAERSRAELRTLIKAAQTSLTGLDSGILAGFLDLYQKVL
ncbi:polyprenyl synthetase family protein [Lactobacillus xylocopicola]|uniref:Geranyltranstransferase n=1 Tax=Lactobacillus xylocopicola TaxID=2976676 RepID=A0ABM8BHG2_9LACO|nr:polyprenyl synthetase family protein [Lactobacillus xylocopicola]BDR60697.1 geranyltranstransferase [Lactobacillus xylocopicola]